jgi:hypothetical protein
VKEIKDINVKSSVAYKWLSRKPQRGRKKIFEATYISKVEYGEFSVSKLKNACHKIVQTSFLTEYKKSKNSSLSFDKNDQDYYNFLRYYKDGREKRSEQEVQRRLKIFMRMYDDIDNNGWRKKLSNGYADYRSLSAVSVLNFHEDRLQEFGLGPELKSKVRSGTAPPFRVIDGHHRLACAIVLGMKSVPVVIYTLTLNKELKRGRI